MKIVSVAKIAELANIPTNSTTNIFEVFKAAGCKQKCFYGRIAKSGKSHVIHLFIYEKDGEKYGAWPRHGCGTTHSRVSAGNSHIPQRLTIVDESTLTKSNCCAKCFKEKHLAQDV